MVARRQAARPVVQKVAPCKDHSLPLTQTASGRLGVARRRISSDLIGSHRSSSELIGAHRSSSELIGERIGAVRAHRGLSNGASGFGRACYRADGDREVDLMVRCSIPRRGSK